MSQAEAAQPHLMLKELREQPAALAQALDGRLQESGERFLLDELVLAPAELQALQRVEIVACGSSRYAGMVGAYFLEALGGLPVRVHAASEFRDRRLRVDGRCLVLAISQSGETADTLGAARVAGEQGGRLVALVNAPDSTLAREAGSNLALRAGPELGVPSTKAFTNTMLVLQLLALYLGHTRGAITPAAVRTWLAELQALPRLVEEALATFDDVRKLAARYLDRDNFLFLGRGTGYPLALEGALKLKEVAYVHAEGMAGGELRHGPLAMIDERIPVVALATHQPSHDKTVGDIRAVKERGGRVLAIVSEADTRAAAQAEASLVLPRTGEWQAPVVTAVALQLFAYHSALLRGRDVDRPRHLAKAVTSD